MRLCASISLGRAGRGSGARPAIRLTHKLCDTTLITFGYILVTFPLVQKKSRRNFAKRIETYDDNDSIAKL